MSDSPQVPTQVRLPVRGVSLEGTLAYEQSLVNSQVTALDEAIALCDERDRLWKQAREVRSALEAVPVAIEKEFRQQEAELQEAVLTAKRAHQEAQAHSEACQRIVRESQARVQALEAGDFTDQDRTRIEKAGKEAEGAHFPVLQRLKSEIEACTSRLATLRGGIQSSEAQLAEATAELGAMSRREIPTKVQAALDQATSRAERQHAAQVKGHEQLREELATSLRSLESELEKTRRRIESAERNSRELEKLTGQGLFARLGSPVWWGSFGTDYAQAGQEASDQKAKLDRSRAELLKELERADCELRQRIEGKQATIDRAIAEELQCQTEMRQQAVQQLPNQLGRLHADLSTAKQDYTELSRQIDAAKSASTAAGQAAAVQERGKLLQEAAGDAAQANRALIEAEAGAARAKSVYETAMAELEELRRHRESVRHERQQQHNSQLAVNQENLERIAQDLMRLTAQHGLGVAAPFARDAFVTARDSRLARIRQLYGDGRDQTANDPEFSDSRPRVNRRRASVASTPTSDGQSGSGAEVLSHFYIDLARNADETTTSVSHVSSLRRARGDQFFPGWVPNDGLRFQLLDLRRRFGPAFFPKWSPETDILLYFQELFFPDSFTGSFLFSNISLEKSFPLLCVRPSVISPRVQQSLPQGMTLAVCGHLFDNRTNADNPVLVVQRIVDMSSSPPWPFEKQRTVITFALADRLYPGFQRQRNLLTTDFVTSLPPISVRTRDRLQDWLAYLGWKDRLIQANLDGLRFVQVEVLPEGQIRFLALAPSKDRYDQCRKLFRKDELRAFELGYSRDPWNFEYNENHRGRDVELGDFVRDEPLKSMTNVPMEVMPWDNPYPAYVYFRLNDDDQNEFDSMIQSGNAAEVAAVFRDRIHQAGFLALSVVGDVALVRRQRREIEQLQQQSGYAPFLSSYLFDIKAANTPAEVLPIADDQWFRSDLNDDQKQAVRMMISAPDLAMVQGPPGTGKTTMIAEAAWHLTRQGKKGAPGISGQPCSRQRTGTAGPSSLHQGHQARQKGRERPSLQPDQRLEDILRGHRPVLPPA